MFLSQKGSLGRNPMINRVGQRLLQLFEGASAAYSLRDLASNIASVVRVRRASDNSEKDFSAADVSSGAMTQWVNAQIVPPLDVRELVDGERTGDLVEAAAAYSLRNLSTSYTGNVVDVRRSSDDAVDSFTAAEVADGTLTDWVSAGFISNGVFTNLDFESFSGATSSGFSAANTTSTGFANSAINAGSTGDVLTITFDLALTYGSPSLSLRGGGGSGAVKSNLTTYTTSGSYTATLTATDAFNRITFSEGDVPSEFTISNFKVSSADGFVETWYDQSGNGNHATQGTDAKQPKIVDAGSLVSGGIDFDGVDDSLATGNLSLFTLNSVSSFVVSTIRTGGGAVASITELGEGSNRFGNPYKYGSTYGFRYGTEAAAAQPETVDSTEALTSLIAGASGAEGYNNGTSIKTYGTPDTTAIVGEPITVGKSFAGTPSCLVQEAIFYTSDQSDNRTAIEANIGETYGIDLPSGVDTGYDEVDGFVETWYDQSGNGNDAVQATAGSQPKIVDAGVLVTDNNGKIALNGKSARLDMPSNAPMLSSDGTYSLFAAVDLPDQTLGNDTFNDFIKFESSGSGGASENRKPLWSIARSTGKLNCSTPSFSGAGGSTNATFTETKAAQLLTNICNPALSTGNNLLYNSGSLIDSSDTATEVNTQTLTGFSARLFDLQETTVETFLSEVIYYPSDQSANREGIEDNINNQYDIY